MDMNMLGDAYIWTAKAQEWGLQMATCCLRETTCGTVELRDGGNYSTPHGLTTGPGPTVGEHCHLGKDRQDLGLGKLQYTSFGYGQGLRVLGS